VRSAPSPITNKKPFRESRLHSHPSRPPFSSIPHWRLIPLSSRLSLSVQYAGAGFRDRGWTTIYIWTHRSLCLGDGTGGSTRYSPVFSPLSSPVTVTIYGRIPARQNVRVGSYTDSITATINF